MAGEDRHKLLENDYMFGSKRYLRAVSLGELSFSYKALNESMSFIIMLIRELHLEAVLNLVRRENRTRIWAHSAYLCGDLHWP